MKDKPTYIDRINAFWNWRMFNPITDKAMALYFALLHCANRAGFPEEICIPTSTLLSMIGMEIRDLYRTRNLLEQIGLVEIEKGKRGQSATYRLTPISDRISDNISDRISDNISDTYGNIYRIDKDKDKDIKEIPPKGGVKKSAPRFDPPTVEQVREYCKERGNYVDADRFVDFYSAKGWMVGKNRMKDWKAAVRTWERDSHPPAGQVDKNVDAAIREWEERHNK